MDGHTERLYFTRNDDALVPKILGTCTPKDLDDAFVIAYATNGLGYDKVKTFEITMLLNVIHKSRIKRANRGLRVHYVGAEVKRADR